MRLLQLFLLLSFSFLARAQSTITDSIYSSGMFRKYVLYVPASYSVGQSAPLIINMHGFTSTMQQQMVYGDFRPIADTAGFLIVHPEGAVQNGIPTFNTQLVATQPDDVLFISQLIDSIKASYNIDLQRVYATGMSMGGYMSYTLACQLSNKIAAIASVTGTMSPSQRSQCHPARAVPVMEVHGTADLIVPYGGNTTALPIDTVVKFWAQRNACSSIPQQTTYPNTNLLDLSTVDRIWYGNGTNGAGVLHLKVQNGGHTWPGSSIAIPGFITNQDINASLEIWRFFRSYNLGQFLSVAPTIAKKTDWVVYPNPVQGWLRVIDANVKELKLYNAQGYEVLHSVTQQLNTQSLASGVYVLCIVADGVKRFQKVVVQ